MKNNNFNWWMIIAIVALLLLFFGNFGNSGFGRGLNGNSNSGYGMMSGFYSLSSGFWFMGGFMIIFWALIVFLVVWIIRQLQNQNNSQKSVRRRR